MWRYVDEALAVASKVASKKLNFFGACGGQSVAERDRGPAVGLRLRRSQNQLLTQVSYCTQLSATGQHPVVGVRGGISTNTTTKALALATPYDMTMIDPGCFAE